MEKKQDKKESRIFEIASMEHKGAKEYDKKSTRKNIEYPLKNKNKSKEE